MRPFHKILLIVKDPLQKQLYHEFLAAAGYSVYITEDIIHALAQLVLSDLPNLIILDTRYPDHQIKKFIKTINNHYQWSKVPVLMVDSVDKGSQISNNINRRPFIFTQSIDPQDIVKYIKKLLKIKKESVL